MNQIPANEVTVLFNCLGGSGGKVSLPALSLSENTRDPNPTTRPALGLAQGSAPLLPLYLKGSWVPD